MYLCEELACPASSLCSHAQDRLPSPCPGPTRDLWADGLDHSDAGQGHTMLGSRGKTSLGQRLSIMPWSRARICTAFTRTQPA